jgi:hypothetical protein
LARLGAHPFAGHRSFLELGSALNGVVEGCSEQRRREQAQTLAFF